MSSHSETTKPLTELRRDDQAVALAQRFHEAYERLAPEFGYETRRASAKPWAEVPEQNRRLMAAVCREAMVPFVEQRDARDERIRALSAALSEVLDVVTIDEDGWARANLGSEADLERLIALLTEEADDG